VNRHIDKIIDPVISQWHAAR